MSYKVKFDLVMPEHSGRLPSEHIKTTATFDERPTEFDLRTHLPMKVRNLDDLVCWYWEKDDNKGIVFAGAICLGRFEVTRL